MRKDFDQKSIQFIILKENVKLITFLQLKSSCYKVFLLKEFFRLKSM